MRKEKMENLMQDWMEKQEKDSNCIASFILDGIINYNEYEKTQEKILFLAKEGNTGNKMVAPNRNYFWLKSVADGISGKTLFSNRIALLANAWYAKDYERVSKNHEVLHKIAFMNLNKCGGGRSCDVNYLEEYTKNYADEIEEEISIIQPNIIVCCGYDVYRLLQKYIRISNDIKVIQISHPSYFALSDRDYLMQFKFALEGKVWETERRRMNREANIQPKYLLVDTCATYKGDWCIDMLNEAKFKAFGDAAERFMGRFNENDHIVYYHKGLGAVACGRVKTGEIKYSADTNERYVEVEMETPVKDIHSVEELRGISAGELNVIHGEITNTGKKFWYASTVKSPYLTVQEYNKIVEILVKKYNELEG